LKFGQTAADTFEQFAMRSTFGHRAGVDASAQEASEIMKRVGWLHRALVGLASLGLLLPGHVLAAGSSPAPPTASAKSRTPASPNVIDVALQSSGVLRGVVVDQQGALLSKTEVKVWQKDQQITATITDEQGRFAVSNLRGGVYQITAAGGQGIYRVWAVSTAPPVAQPGAMVVAGHDLVRGQASSPVLRFFTNPWVLAGLVGAAIAIPIALSNDDDSTS
jgi:hypothetical protein